MPLISVIVPVYKVEPYLRRCVDSIIAQTFTDFELILVDDGSPDNCGAMCDEYAAKDSRIHVIHKENGGLSSARNAGMESASGEYVLFLDGDDHVAPGWCTGFVKLINPDERKLIFGGFVTERLISGSIVKSENLPGREPMQWPMKSFITLQLQGWTGFACNVLYDMRIIKSTGLAFSNEYACYK